MVVEVVVGGFVEVVVGGFVVVEVVVGEDELLIINQNNYFYCVKITNYSRPPPIHPFLPPYTHSALIYLPFSPPIISQDTPSLPPSLQRSVRVPLEIERGCLNRSPAPHHLISPTPSSAPPPTSA